MSFPASYAAIGSLYKANMKQNNNKNNQSIKNVMFCDICDDMKHILEPTAMFFDFFEGTAMIKKKMYALKTLMTQHYNIEKQFNLDLFKYACPHLYTFHLYRDQILAQNIYSAMG